MKFPFSTLAAEAACGATVCKGGGRRGGNFYLQVREGGGGGLFDPEEGRVELQRSDRC